MKIVAVILALTLPAYAELGLPDASNVDAPAKARAPRETTTAKPVKPAVTLPVVRPAGPTEGVIRFRNGDSLHGVLEQIDATGQVAWRHTEASEPLRFSLQNVMQISLAGVGRNESAGATAAVSLTNGDTLRGAVKSLDEATLTLDTWYAGTMQIKRVMIRRITPLLGGEAIVMEGLGSLADWKRGGQPEAWQLRNGALLAMQPGTIGRDVGLPDQSSVEFDLTWLQLPVMLHVGLYGQRPDGIFGDGNTAGYWLMFAGNNAQLQRATRTETSQLGQIDIRKFIRNGKMRVAIRADKTKKSIALLLDGQLVKAWTDPGEWSGDGRCLTFVSQSRGEQNLRISNLIVREWSGDVETGGMVVTGQQDVLRLANNDRVTGTVESIKDGTVAVVSTVAPLTIPLERVAEINFASENFERARRMAGDVIAAFHDGGRVTLALESVDAKTVNGEGENFGKVNFSRDAFRELQLHIYDEDRGEDMDIDSGAIPQWSPTPQRTLPQ